MYKSIVWSSEFEDWWLEILTIDLYNGFYSSEKVSNTAYNRPNFDPLFDNNTNIRTKNVEKLNFLTENGSKKDKKNIFDGNNVNKKSETTKENICENKLQQDKKSPSLSTSQFEEIRFWDFRLFVDMIENTG